MSIKQSNPIPEKVIWSKSHPIEEYLAWLWAGTLHGLIPYQEETTK